MIPRLLKKNRVTLEKTLGKMSSFLVIVVFFKAINGQLPPCIGNWELCWDGNCNPNLGCMGIPGEPFTCDCIGHTPASNPALPTTRYPTPWPTVRPVLPTTQHPAYYWAENMELKTDNGLFVSYLFNQILYGPNIYNRC